MWLRWNIGHAPVAKRAFDEKVLPALNTAVAAGHTVLFHCKKGRHRSALCAAVAIMAGTGVPFKRAAAMVQDWVAAQSWADSGQLEETSV